MSYQCTESFSEVARGHDREGFVYHAMIFKLYFDDSSDDQHKKLRACAGLIGTANQWDILLALWSHVTRTYGLKKPFRAADCEGGHGQFKWWKKPRRDALMAELVTAILNSKLMGYGGIVPVEEYAKAFPTAKEDDCYFLAVRQVIMNAAYITHSLGHDVSIWFEKDGKTDAEVERIFDSISRFSAWPDSRALRSITGSNKKLIPLQTADLIAREGFKHIDNLGKRPMRLPAQRMLGHLAYFHWNEKSLKYLAENGGPENLAVLASWDERNAPRMGHYIWK